MLEFRKISQPKELWQIFSEECSDHVVALQSFSQNKLLIENPDNLRKLSSRLHRLRGSLGFIGFSELTLEVKQAEDLLKNKDSELISALISLATKISNLSIELKHLLEN